MSVLLQLNSLFQEIFDNPELQITADTSPDDLPDWDSVAQVKLVLAIEEAFGVRFTSDDISGIHRAGDFLNALQKQGSIQ